MTAPDLFTLATILFSAVLLVVLTRRSRAGRLPSLRPLPPYQAINQQVGRAIESGRRLHLAVGRGRLTGANAPASVAALAVLAPLAEDGGGSGVPPTVTVGDATLAPAAQDTARRAYRRAGRPRIYRRDAAEFVADSGYPFAYAAGVSQAIGHDELATSLLVGRFGEELAIMTEAGSRSDITQIIGADDPTALAVGAAATEHLLIGEEFLAAGAYLNGRPDQLAALQTQDWLRWFIAALIVTLAFVNLIIG